MAGKIEKEIAEGVEEMKKESAAAGYKAEKNVERVNEFLKPTGAPFPSDSETAEGTEAPAAPEKDESVPTEEVAEEIEKGVADMKKESAAAGYKAEQNVERVKGFLKKDATAPFPSDSER